MLRRFVLALAAAALALPVARAAERQIAFEFHLLTISDECHAALGQPGAAGGTRLLTAGEASALLTKAQADGRTRLLAAPKLVALEGQEATLRTENQQAFVTGVDRQECNGMSVFVPAQESLSSGVAMTLRGAMLPGGQAIAVKVKDRRVVRAARAAHVACAQSLLSGPLSAQ
jgi:hypothetical protein